ncbi:helix-turn-helix domain-containing protein [Lysobacter sp. KIS68-7]|uniref:DNA-3-methyladenine glycosylase 2 family protein n=1 Tax=Lysobacter sp. KIS68-7 TaxID=2904252 RepID=UPI001E4310E3|nr:AlkA N-terminal domain-containing protein [Lysobacter sp. KIS68-7]UHQ21155.1 helix-turn-helix domain-containing protein [Lysobacter sp. KIS68-7]
MPGVHMPSAQVCEQARLSRDPRFDGLFFTGVTSTRIYCRPVCPAPAPKPRNIIYYPSAAAAEAAGFRPCLRCRPELAPGDGAWRRGDDAMARALKLIDAGLLAEQPLAVLADRVHLGERQLRRLFVERLGAPPSGVHATRRLLFAKQLLTETTMPITQVALAAGFGSLRRFNTVFHEAYRMAPRELRKREPSQVDDTLGLRLGFRPPYDFEAMLAFLRTRALPGVEQVDHDAYARLIAPMAEGDAPGWLCVTRDAKDPHALRLQVHGVPPARLLEVVARVRRMFDLDAEPRTIADALSVHPRLSALVDAAPGVRLPSAWDGFELAVRAILGQQISVAAARTMAMRVAQRWGTPLANEAAPGLGHLFPTAAALADADLESIGLISARAKTIRGVARAVLEGDVDFRTDATLEEFVERWTALPGIGPWTAHYIAMRALGHPDAFPADDLVLQRALPADGSRLTARALAAAAEAWRPWRAYSVIQLWRDASHAPTAAATAPGRSPARRTRPAHRARAAAPVSAE